MSNHASNTTQKPVLALLGPTAVGKTTCAIALAERHPKLQIISMDSAMVYKGMDIGTGKPRPEVLRKIPHALIDIRDPWEPYSAADFAQDVRQLIQEIHARDKIPFIVGGTFLYFKALEQGLADLPKAQPNIRARLQAQAEEEGWPALHAKLMTIDPPSAQRIKPNDSQRITRALEVFEISGKPLSIWFLESHAGEKSKSDMKIQSFALLPKSRAILHEQIRIRLLDMMKQGFLEEVRHLLENPKITLNLPSMKSVGYRQLAEYLVYSQNTLEDAQERAIAATRQLAKRQLTWLRGLKNIIISEESKEIERLVISCAFS